MASRAATPSSLGRARAMVDWDGAARGGQTADRVINAVAAAPALAPPHQLLAPSATQFRATTLDPKGPRVRLAPSTCSPPTPDPHAGPMLLTGLRIACMTRMGSGVATVCGATVACLDLGLTFGAEGSGERDRGAELRRRQRNAPRSASPGGGGAAARPATACSLRAARRYFDLLLMPLPPTTASPPSTPSARPTAARRGTSTSTMGTALTCSTAPSCTASATTKRLSSVVTAARLPGSRGR